MTNPSPPSSPFEQVVEKLESIKRNDATPRYEYGELSPSGEKPPGGQRWLCPRELADDALGLLQLVEEQPEERPLIGSNTELPECVGLCPDPSHTGEFYMPHGGTCPECSQQLVEYRQGGEQPRGEPST